MSLKDSLHVKESTKVLDSGFHAVDSGFKVLDSGFFVSGNWILDSNPSESAYPYKGRKDIRKEVATKSLLKPLFLHCMLTHHNISMDLNNKEKIDTTSSR